MDSPVLYPGDKIHLAIPIDATPSKSEALAQTRMDGKALVDLYAQQGVEVSFWSSNSNLTHPVVVAVFRAEEKK